MSEHLHIHFHIQRLKRALARMGLNAARIFSVGMAYAGISEQVKEKPVGVEILGEKVVLYRDSAGTIQCLHDVCPHRGAPLHKVCLPC